LATSPDGAPELLLLDRNAHPTTVLPPPAGGASVPHPNARSG